MASPRKMRVTLSLDAELIETIDTIKQQTGGKSRSAVVEKILLPWYQAQLQKKIERETEEYYLALSDEEREEDRQWTQLTETQIDRLWDYRCCSTIRFYHGQEELSQKVHPPIRR